MNCLILDDYKQPICPQENPHTLKGCMMSEERAGGRLDLEYEEVMENYLKKEAVRSFNVNLTPPDISTDTFTLENGTLTVKKNLEFMSVFYKLFGEHPPSTAYNGMLE